MSQWNRLRQPVVLNHSVEELKAAVSSTISEFMKLENSFMKNEKKKKHFTSDRKQTQYGHIVYIDFSVRSEMCLIMTNQDLFF